jgi:hypothetical protein
MPWQPPACPSCMWVELAYSQTINECHMIPFKQVMSWYQIEYSLVLRPFLGSKWTCHVNSLHVQAVCEVSFLLGFKWACCVHYLHIQVVCGVKLAYGPTIYGAKQSLSLRSRVHIKLNIDCYLTPTCIYTCPTLIYLWGLVSKWKVKFREWFDIHYTDVWV